MALSPEHEAQILRYYHAERWRIGTIAAQLGLHRDTVARVLAQAGLPGTARAARLGDRPLSALHPRHARAVSAPTAARLYDMVRARGYPGRPDHFRHLIAEGGQKIGFLAAHGGAGVQRNALVDQVVALVDGSPDFPSAPVSGSMMRVCRAVVTWFGIECGRRRCIPFSAKICAKLKSKKPESKLGYFDWSR